MATSYKYQSTSDIWTYGAELELVDWPRREPLPNGMQVDDGNYTSVNSNGIAVDGKGKSYHLGGEILTAPSARVTGPAEQWLAIHRKWPETTFNYRTGLNIHVRVPGLRSDIEKLKMVQRFVHKVMPDLLNVIDPIPTPSRLASSLEKRCCRVRKKDHHSLLPAWRVELQQNAKTVKEFFDAEAIHLKTGKVHWAIVPRACVNLRQILQTDTIEFRHFFMPATAEELVNSTIWCKQFLEASLDGGECSSSELLIGFGEKQLPKPLPYDPWLDEGFFYTSPHYHPPEVVAVHIKEWLANGVRRS